MGAEDMSYFLEAVPGCYLRLGSGNPDHGVIHPHHSALFNFDEAALPIGVETPHPINTRLPERAGLAMSVDAVAKTTGDIKWDVGGLLQWLSR